MPTKGTVNTPIRFTEEDKAKVRIIQERKGLPSFAAAVRHAVHWTYLVDDVLVDMLTKAAEKNSRKKSGKGALPVRTPDVYSECGDERDARPET